MHYDSFHCTKASLAIDKCSSLSNENVTFEVGYFQQENKDDEILKCLSAALPASGISSPQEFWAITRSDFEKNQCYVYNIETDGEDKVIQTNFSEQVSCKKEEYPFYCLGFFSIDKLNKRDELFRDELFSVVCKSNVLHWFFYFPILLSLVFKNNNNNELCIIIYIYI
ncbi:hypothetical protein Avbf_11268 [Armadillidium vulgare]|nr:hypothetical protein Avbf_11268 [Armadillidium vulgare]